MYNYQVIDSQIVFSTLYLLLTFGASLDSKYLTMFEMINYTIYLMYRYQVIDSQIVFSTLYLLLTYTFK